MSEKTYTNITDDDKTARVRRNFEFYMSDGGTYPRAIERDSKGGYMLATAMHAWTVWQAAVGTPPPKSSVIVERVLAAIINLDVDPDEHPRRTVMRCWEAALKAVRGLSA